MTTAAIEADSMNIVRQASGTTRDHLIDAIEAIDEHLGKGYARKNPALIAAFMQAAATDYAATIIAQQVRAGLETVADSMPSVDLDGLSTLSGSLEEIGKSVQNVAAMLDMHMPGTSSAAG
jgi:hypothetical protein